MHVVELGLCASNSTLPGMTQQMENVWCHRSLPLQWWQLSYAPKVLTRQWKVSASVTTGKASTCFLSSSDHMSTCPGKTQISSRTLAVEWKTEEGNEGCQLPQVIGSIQESLYFAFPLVRIFSYLFLISNDGKKTNGYQSFHYLFIST